MTAGRIAFLAGSWSAGVLGCPWVVGRIDDTVRAGRGSVPETTQLAFQRALHPAVIGGLAAVVLAGVAFLGREPPRQPALGALLGSIPILFWYSATYASR